MAAVELFLDSAIYSIWSEPPLWYWLIMPFLFVALPEEFAKFLVVKKVAYDHSKFNEIMDGITYCIVASMGFAAFENINYTFQFGIGTGIMRAFTAVPAHALFSGIMGYYIGVAKFTKNRDVKNSCEKVSSPASFPRLYDFLLCPASPT